MILEKETFEKYGYYSRDLKQKSHKKIIAVCDDCGKVRITSKSHYHALCNSCSKKGKKFSEETREKLSDAKKGENNANWKGGKVKRICQICGRIRYFHPSEIKLGKGKFCTRKCKEKWHSGKNSPMWKGGISFEPYCHKFNNEFKEYIRDKFGRICFLCDKTEEENGQRLSVHHVNYNKDCGCDDDETCQFVPLCIACNTQVNSNRDMWEKKIKGKMQNKLNGWYI